MIMVFDGSQSTDATKLVFYLDGTAQTLTFAGGSQPTATAAGLTTFRLALDNAYDTYATGLIDDVRLYSVAITTNIINLLQTNP